MAKDNEQYARQQELARAFDEKRKARHEAINKRLQAILGKDREMSAPFQGALTGAFALAFAKNKYPSPSVFVRKELSWILTDCVYPRFHEAFYDTIDRMQEYPTDVSWHRRGFRSRQWAAYGPRFYDVFSNFWRSGFIDADICDILTSNLPEDVLCYLQTRDARFAPFAPEVLAFELDKGNPKLEQIVTDIINGENSFSTVSHALIRGIVLSNNERMHEQLCKLLLAARLQEGLRQAICESADMGSQKAFMAILGTILENDLIRFSSVKRAVGTWLGIANEETRDLERVSAKSVTLAQRCLQEPQFREECLQSEDAMQIYIALWSLAKDSVETAAEKLGQIAERGTRHQVLAAGYLVNNTENGLLRHYTAKVVLRRFPEEWDILAVYLPCFVPYHTVLASAILRNTPNPEVKFYFSSNQEAQEYCDWLVALHDKLKKKELVFEPCIFPWHKAVLTKSDLLEKAMVIAFLGKDMERVKQLCSRLSEFDAVTRDTYLRLLDRVEKDEPVRKALIAGLCDRSADTRFHAAKILREMELTAEEYLSIEDMLRLRYEDLRSFATEFLLKQKDDALCESIRRLLSASKTEKRTAALDMLLQLHKKAERTHVVEICMDYVRAISKPTTQEQILIDQLLPKATKVEKKVLFTEADRYLPQVEVDDFARECIREFTAIFPDSKLENQVLAGKPVAAKAPLLKPKACASAQEAEKLIKAMEDGATFSLAELQDLAKNRVVAPIVSKLVLRSDALLGFFNGEALVDLTDNILTAEGETQLIVAHPFHLYTSGQWSAFQEYLFDNQIIQPFRQAFRELYVKTADELGGFHSLRYAGNQIQPKKAAACLKERRWVADVEAGLQKVYYKENIVATIFAMADWFTPADIEAPTLEYVAFFHRKTGEALKIDDIPEVIFSEVMRDVDMAVSVAHAGGVDPETSHSTVEMRAAILSFTLPLLRLNNVRVDGNHALVEGKLARYSIHLGSGVIHQIGGTMLSVLPVHSQHRGRIFLPFVDEDPKTAEIISKVILFSEDHKLKDPTILSQIAPVI